MLKSYFVSAIRNLLKHKAYSLVKIAGLAFGLAAALIIYLYVVEDLSYDRFHTKSDRIVRLMTIDNAEGVSSKVVGVTQPRLGPAAKEELPEVLEVVRFTNGGRYDLSYNGNNLKCEAAFRVDSTVFDVFDFPVIEGASVGVLSKPGSIAITESLAKKIFGSEQAVGKTIKLNLNTDLHVTAVLADPPRNSHIQFDLLHSLVPGQNEEGLRQALDTWQSIFTYTYLLLDKPADIESLNSKLRGISKKNNAFEFFIPISQPLRDVHLHSKDVLFETNANKSDILNVYVLSTVAILILILAVVNFTNLVTANAAGRAKEIGMRKVIGAVRGQLIRQYLVESVVITMLSGVLAVMMVAVSLPWLNDLYQRFADLSVLSQPVNLSFLFLLMFVVGVIAGLYPAFILSSFKPIFVLKGSFKSSTGGVRLRKALVVLQFTISIALMVGTGVVYQQMKFIYTADLGFNREQVVTIQQNGDAVSRATTLKNELTRSSYIIATGTSSVRMGQQLGRTNIIPEGSDGETNIIASVMSADDKFLPTMAMQIVKGRNFSVEFADTSSMIINEEMVKLLKWKDPVGRTISLETGPGPADLRSFRVIGVVKNFHFATIRHKLEPMFMLYNANNNALSIRIKTSNVKETISFIEESWKKVNPGTTFEYAFLDEQFANLYRNEEAFSAMFTHFTVLAMAIAALGLFALSAYTADQRRKEIGIRKVLGATSGSILLQLSNEFLKLIFVAFVLASLAAYYTMSKWLEDFQYHIDISADIFLLAGVASLVIAMVTISFQALKATFSNPVNSLRSE